MTATPSFQLVVVLRLDKIGDLLVSTPALRNLRRALPGARITLVTSPSCADVLRGWNAIDSIETFRPGGGPRERREFIDRLRSQRPDVIFVFTPWSALYRLARRVAAPVRVGFGYRSRPLDFAVARVTLTHAVFSRVPEAVERASEVPHHADELLATLRALDIPAPRCPMEVPIPEADLAWARQLLTDRGMGAPPIAIHLSQKWLDEGWTADDVSALTAAVARIDGYNRRVLLTVGPGDRDLRSAVQTRLRRTPEGRNEVLALDDLTFVRWAAVLASSVLVVSPDTGAIHVGSATGRPVVGVYAEHRVHVLSRQWAPWMVPSRTLAKGRGEAGVTAIVAATASLLREVAPGGFRA